MPTAHDQRQIRAIARGLDGFTERAVIKLTLDVHHCLTERTGADTGWMRASWIPSVRRPSTATAGPRPKSGETVNDAAAAAAGTARVASYRLSKGSTFVVNNVPYAGIRNEHGFTKARDSRGVITGPGFVEDCVREAVRAAESLRPRP